MKVNAKIATAALAIAAVASAASAAGVQTLRLGLPRPAVRVDNERFEHGRFQGRRETFRDERRRFTGGLPFWGAYGAPYGPYPAEAPAYAEPAYAPPPPQPAAYAQPYNSGPVCPVVWTWSARAHAATRRSYCD